MPIKRDSGFTEREDIQSVYGLKTFVENVFGASGDVRIVLPNGTVASKAATKVLTLTDGSEVFEVHLK
jgi:hypothetical protein